jgi:hypothetical protein
LDQWDVPAEAVTAPIPAAATAVAATSDMRLRAGRLALRGRGYLA